MADRSEIIARIKALRARASDEASSEAEVAAAASRAARLMAEHEISEKDIIERGSDGVIEGMHNAGRVRLHPALEVCGFQIGAYTHCAAMTKGGANLWAGQPEDVEFAIYLSELVQAASERAYRNHWRKLWALAPKAKYRLSFMHGFALGVAQLLEGEIARREQAQASSATGTALVVAKEAVIAEYMAEHQPGIKNHKPRKQRKPAISAFFAGKNAGERVNINRPLEGKEDLERIG
ncbi:hypothetical protein BMI86_10105 [Thioclava sp. DLFJ5-1]|uniref:DUF2786 domain-containing protein n=1 Tax=Thioclava sp. DLFJ5-1 TaxID=1915314 RepID=UPI000997A2BF|nr:DUF2786 domain-containing protein [Thioclava sp. DLFJ5-1]OOY20850.1 hypothetical protein BMI86_10105 [Thioclava sp. DLFJ5-1]